MHRDLAGVRAVVTLGTPWSPVSVDSLDAVPAGEALRLLAALIRIIDAAAADPADPAPNLPHGRERPDKLVSSDTRTHAATVQLDLPATLKVSPQAGENIYVPQVFNRNLPK